MKTFFTASFILILSLNAFADCTDAYTAKAYKRARTNIIVRQVAVGTAIAAVGTLMIVSAGSAGPILIPASAIIALGDGAILATVRTNGDNTYFDVLDAINSAKRGETSTPLYDRINKKLGLEDNNEVRMKIASIVNELNETYELCGQEDGEKTYLWNFKMLTKRVVQELQDQRLD